MTAATTRVGAALSRRELEVLRLVAEGHDTAIIARLLFCSESTVKTHLTSLFVKLGAKTRAHAVAIAYQTGVLAIDRPGLVTPTMAATMLRTVTDAIEKGLIR